MPNRYARDTVFEPTLTGTYQTSGMVEAEGHQKLAVLVEYTQGNEDTMRLKVEFSDDGNIWFQESAESLAGSLATITALEREFAATGRFMFAVDLVGCFFRFSVKGTGADPTGGKPKIRYKKL